MTKLLFFNTMKVNGWVNNDVLNLIVHFWWPTVRIPMQTFSHPPYPLAIPLDAPNAMGMWGQHHDGDDREETAPVQRDKSQAETSRQSSVQAGQHAHPPQLEEDQRGKEIRPASVFHPNHCILGHCYIMGDQRCAAMVTPNIDRKKTCEGLSNLPGFLSLFIFDIFILKIKYG